MKKIFKISYLVLLALFAVSCSDDDQLDSINIALPSNIDTSIDLSQDNSGQVNFLPTAENANFFVIEFGDGVVSDTISTGESLSHVYDEGDYDAVINALNLKGQSAKASKPVVVSFLPPENLAINLEKDSNDPFLVRVSPTADLAAGFEVTFGELEGEEPVQISSGETVEYTYSNVGDYTIEVTALSGGEATISESETVTITDPLVIPIDFESETVDYTFNNFGGGEGAGVPIVDNPAPNTVNDSPKVGQYTKVQGSEVWAGTSALLNENIDFSSTTTIAVDVYSPEAGVPVLFKIEQEGNPDVFVESTKNTTVANEWETLTFTLPEANQNDYTIIALFFNFNTSGTGETYYFDNIRLTDPVVLGLPLDFEEGASFYSFTEFGGAPTEVIENPDQSGLNTSGNVGRLLKVSGSETWAGSFIDIDEPADLSVSTTLSLKVWSPKTNNQVILKLENPVTGAEAEATEIVNTANEWVEVEFDFSGADITEEWTRLVVFFDFGNPGDETQYFFDDLSYVTSESSDIVGTWKMAEEDGALGVGPSVGDVSWFACDGDCITERACYYNDTYTFSSDGSFSNGFGGDGETWVEEWQSGNPDACAAPVAPHNASNSATYTFDPQDGTVTLTGEGAFIGLAKAVNAGELPNVEVPNEVTYSVSFESSTVMNVYIESGDGVFWQYKLIKQ